MNNAVASPIVTVSLIVHDDFSHIAQALEHLQANTVQALRVVVTINRGDVAKFEQLRATFPTVQHVVNGTPKGFAANHNAVMRSATTPYCVLLNDDALLSQGTLDTLVDHLEKHPDCGIVGPLVRNPNGTAQLSAFSDPTLARMLVLVSGLGAFVKSGSLLRRAILASGLGNRLNVESLRTSTSTRIVPVIVGVCMVVRCEAVHQAGLMDEDTLVYGEEFGWQKRMREKGWHAALVTEAEVVHLNTAQDLSGWKLAEHRKGMLNYFIRYQPRWQSLALRTALVAFHGVYAVLWLPIDRDRSKSHWQACLVGWRWHPQ
jgi:GT2 family glycosyltransferase